MKIDVTCAWCRATFQRERGQVRCARSFCADCKGAANRSRNPLTNEQKRARKAAYDAARRETLAAEIKAAKAKAHRETYDPEKARVTRDLPKLRAYHREHNKRPDVKRAKREKDIAIRAAEFGDFAECHQLLIALEREIRQREPSWYERAKARGYYDTPRTQTRKRQANAG